MLGRAANALFAFATRQDAWRAGRMPARAVGLLARAASEGSDQGAEGNDQGRGTSDQPTVLPGRLPFFY